MIAGVGVFVVDETKYSSFDLLLFLLLLLLFRSLLLLLFLFSFFLFRISLASTKLDLLFDDDDDDDEEEEDDDADDGKFTSKRECVSVSFFSQPQKNNTQKMSFNRAI